MPASPKSSLNFPWIDAHCHLADPRFAQDLPAVLQRSREAGVGAWIQGGVGPDDWKRQVALRAELGACLVPVFGLHPWWVRGQTDAAVDAALPLLEAALPGAAGLGELGLDTGAKARGGGGPEGVARQKRAFVEQLRLVKRSPKPLVLHIVKAHGEALAILEKEGPFPRGGLVHSFSASLELARRYLELGFTLSIGAAATREGSQTLKKNLKCLPSEKMVLETDAPDQLPHVPGTDALGGRNEPACLVAIAEVVARARGQDRDQLLFRSAQNLRSLFEPESFF